MDIIKIIYYNILFGKESGILIGKGKRCDEKIISRNKAISNFVIILKII